MTVRQNLGDLLSEVQYRKGKVIITKAGKPVAALIDIALFERIRKLDEEFDRMREELAEAFTEMPTDDAEALVDEAVREVCTRNPRR
ncbi:MAG TPA: type II toxin-antitoxin system prevent-host-death family antitoxin [Burkholderiales bacterium]|nr:type II toxin-antitoxin system prevent-host-death family antitoxin [Burkholderiales bacterium]